MRAAVVALLLACACRIELDHGVDASTSCASMTQNCVIADQHQDFTFLYQTVFEPKCTFSSCHGAMSPAPEGMFDMSTQALAYTNLVGKVSYLDPSRTEVVPMDVNSSFLMVMMGAVMPGEATPSLDAIPQDRNGNFVGTMPKDGGIICCQQLDAMGRWIAAGALND